MGAVVVAVALAGATAVRAQLLRLPSVIPGRAGTGSFLWFNRAFPDLDVELVGAENFSDHRFEVSVLITFRNQRFGHCFVAPDDLRVAVNGHLLEVSQRGHENQRRREEGRGWNGPDYDFSAFLPCTGASFNLRRGEIIETDRPATVTIDQATKHAEMTSATFFQPRRLVLLSARTARPGDTVMVTRQPRSEELVGSSPSIRLERPGADWIELFESNGVTFAGGTWRFVLPPRLAPGHYKVFASRNLADLAMVETCHGVHRCIAQVPTSAYVSEAELDVVE
jgi:hypothetical protein